MLDLRAKEAWHQKKIPIALRRDGKGERLRVKMPFAEDNFQWLKDSRRWKPVWNSKDNCWELPKNWFNDFVERSLYRFGKVYIIQPYREMEICSPSCQEAKGHECNCSCMGEHHGAGSGEGWFTVSDAFAFRWSDRQLACRLLTSR